MAKKKRYRGHFCKVCERILPNEKFSGKGHAVHICKKAPFGCKSIIAKAKHWVVPVR